MGQTLLRQKDISAAIVCFILSQSVEQVLDIWKKRAIHHIQKKESTRESALIDLFQKFALTRLALVESNSSVSAHITTFDDFNKILAEVGGYLTSDEQAAIVYMNYLNHSGASLEVNLLRDRLYQSNEGVMAMNRVQPPQFPLPVERLRVQI